MAKVRLLKDGEAASVIYLHNALGQRVFKSEVTADQTLPDASTLGTGFVGWLKTNFQWMFAQAQANASVGTAYTYADGNLPEWALLGEYDNGSASGAGRTEYVWLPTADGAIPVGLYRGGKFNAIHADHLGTPRLMTSETNTPVWQWPYSGFGNNKPTGILKATANPRQAVTNQPVLLKATAAVEMNLRMPGQMFDSETDLFQNWNREYNARLGRYIQRDPIGLEGGINSFGYADSDPLLRRDPSGLQGDIGAIVSKKAGEAILSRATGSVSQILGEACYMRACTPDGPYAPRSTVETYGDCAGLLTDAKKATPGLAAGLQSLPG